MLAGTRGALIGTGPGCGTAFMFLVVGMLQPVIVLCSVLSPSVRELEDHLPDAPVGPLIRNPAP